MENINIEEYIKDLSPELQEKARACKDAGELMELAGKNKIPLPDEALEAAAGGKDSSDDVCPAGDGKEHHRLKFDRSYGTMDGMILYFYHCVMCKKTFTLLSPKK